MLSCLVYLESHPCSKHSTNDASPERASRAEGVFSASRPPRFPIVSAPLRPILRAFLEDFCSGRSSDPWTYNSPSKLFRINTCKSLSKQTTLTLFRINTYEKHGGRGVLWLTSSLPVSAFHRVGESQNYPLHVQLLTNCPFSIPFVLTFMHRMGGVGDTSHQSRVASHLFARPVTCPEDLHPPYYWSQPFSPTNWQQVHYSFFSLVWEGVMGKFSRSWELVKQSFAILRSDKQLMLFPVLSAIACLIVTAIIATGGAVLMLPAMTSAAAAGERFNPNQSPVFLLGMFSLYVANYFVIVFFNVALVGVA